MVMVTVADARPRGSNWKVARRGRRWSSTSSTSDWTQRSPCPAKPGPAPVANGQVPPKGVAVDSGGLVSMVSVTTVPAYRDAGVTALGDRRLARVGDRGEDLVVLAALAHRAHPGEPWRDEDRQNSDQHQGDDQLSEREAPVVRRYRHPRGRLRNWQIAAVEKRGGTTAAAFPRTRSVTLGSPKAAAGAPHVSGGIAAQVMSRATASLEVATPGPR